MEQACEYEIHNLALGTQQLQNLFDDMDTALKNVSTYTLITILKCESEEDGIQTFTRLLARSLIPKSSYLSGNWWH
jgi:hypothetical protein